MQKVFEPIQGRESRLNRAGELVCEYLIKVCILWGSCDHFCYISRWSALVGGNLLTEIHLTGLITD